MARFKIGINGPDQGRGFHGGQQMAKEALLGAFKGRTGGGFGLPVQRPLAAGDVGGFHRRVQIPMNDGEGGSI